MEIDVGLLVHCGLHTAHFGRMFLSRREGDLFVSPGLC